MGRAQCFGHSDGVINTCVGSMVYVTDNAATCVMEISLRGYEYGRHG